MLFTRCPACQTTFRITADELRKADGEVRCGRCDSVFHAYDGLPERLPERLPESSPATEPAAAKWSTDSFVILEDRELDSSDLDGSQDSAQLHAKPHRWLAGSMVLIVILSLQATHHFRAELANQPVIGPLVRSGYSALGSEITPKWDLEQYKILDWTATTDPSVGGGDTLTITARIRNDGPADQPYPYIRLELKDRWEQTVGRRSFEPAEYLPADHRGSSLMAAGTTVPARLDVVDRNEDAYGFELDVCVDAAAGRITCKSDAVFE